MEPDFVAMLQIASKCSKWKASQMGFSYCDDLQSYVVYNVWKYVLKYIPGELSLDTYTCRWAVKMTAKYVVRERNKRSMVAYDSEVISQLSRNDNELTIDPEDVKFISDLLEEGGICSTGETKKLHQKRLNKITQTD